MGPYAIRHAVAVDAAPLAVVARDTFIATFGQGYPPADLAAFLAETYGPQHQAEEIAEPTAMTLLAEAEGRILGFVQAGELGLPFDAGGRAARELKRLYLVEEAQGLGLAQQLMERVVSWALAEGAQDLYLGVWTENARALAFYGRQGFEVVGAYTFMVGATADDERIMRRRLRD